MKYTGDGVAFSLFGIEVRWYGLIIVSGMMLAVYLSQREAERRGIAEDLVTDLAIIFLPVGVVGARLWYVIFEWDRYREDLSRILNFREGGLAIQGGIIAALIVAFLYCRRKKCYLPRISDIIFPYVAMAQSIGRWGNFTNNEAFGGPTDLPWALEIDGVGVHPTFLYESIGTLSIFLFLVWFTRKKLTTDGQVSMLYLILYGAVRYFVEGFRTDSLWIGPYRTAQLVALAGALIGLIGLYLLNRQEPLAHIPGPDPQTSRKVDQGKRRDKSAESKSKEK